MSNWDKQDILGKTKRLLEIVLLFHLPTRNQMDYSEAVNSMVIENLLFNRYDT
jgi:hypothetical protein